MNRLLTLSILVSSLLTGCGTDSGVDGGGSGSTSTQPSQNVTFEFVQLVEADAKTPVECTIFDGLGQKSGTKYYGKKAKTPLVKVHKADGSFDKNLPVSNNGVVIFSIDDVPDEGYVSIIDSSGAGKPLYDVLSIQKSLLGNYLIRINREQGEVDCYKDGKGLSTKKAFASVLPNGIPSNYYEFETAQSSTSKASFLSAEVEAYEDENVLAKAYNGDILVGYALVPQLTSEPNISATDLNLVNETYPWSTSFDLNALEELTIRLSDGRYSYPWYTPKFTKATDSKISFPYVSTQANWLYKAKGSLLNWNFVNNSTFDPNVSSSLDISLSLTLNDTPAAISNNGTSNIFENLGITSTKNLIQRSHYAQTHSSPLSTLSHTIYSVPSRKAGNEGEVTIPDVGLTNLAPLTPSEVTISLIEKESVAAGFIASFMRSFQPSDPNAAAFPKNEDSVSLLLTPAAQSEQRKAMQMSDYTLVER